MLEHIFRCYGHLIFVKTTLRISIRGTVVFYFSKIYDTVGNMSMHKFFVQSHWATSLVIKHKGYSLTVYYTYLSHLKPYIYSGVTMNIPSTHLSMLAKDCLIGIVS